jgi:hypothetical protein
VDAGIGGVGDADPGDDAHGLAVEGTYAGDGATNPAAAERMQAIFREQLGPIAAAVCPDPAQAETRAALASSQILGMALARYVLCFPPAVAMTREEVIAWLAPIVQRYLTAERP